MHVDEILLYLREIQEALIQELRDDKYKPNPNQLMVSLLID